MDGRIIKSFVVVFFGRNASIFSPKTDILNKKRIVSKHLTIRKIFK